MSSQAEKRMYAAACTSVLTIYPDNVFTIKDLSQAQYVFCEI